MLQNIFRKIHIKDFLENFYVKKNKDAVTLLDSKTDKYSH